VTDPLYYPQGEPVLHDHYRMVMVVRRDGHQQMVMVVRRDGRYQMQVVRDVRRYLMLVVRDGHLRAMVVRDGRWSYLLDAQGELCPLDDEFLEWASSQYGLF
jgi:hypothetical protein